MRHVRSHVMYKHRDFRYERPRDENAHGSQRSTALTARSRTLSPGTSIPDTTHQQPDPSTPTRHRSGTWTGDVRETARFTDRLDPVRYIAHRILTAPSTVLARSAPPLFEQSAEFPFWGIKGAEPGSLDDLQRQYMSCTCVFSHGTCEMVGMTGD
jgi:hypothetical protein